MNNKVFLDTNILLDILFDKRPFSKYTQDKISKLIEQKYTFVLNALSLNNIWYIGSKIDKQATFLYIKSLFQSDGLYDIYELKNTDILNVLKLISNDEKCKSYDFEDLLQYISAKNSNCSYILSNDAKGDFPKLDIAIFRTNPNFIDYLPKF